jgi:hypothetical protein
MYLDYRDLRHIFVINSEVCALLARSPLCVAVYDAESSLGSSLYFSVSTGLGKQTLILAEFQHVLATGAHISACPSDRSTHFSIAHILQHQLQHGLVIYVQI